MQPGYFTREFNRSLVDGKEVLQPNGPGSWRIRLSPRQPGAYKVDVQFRDRTDLREKSFAFTCRESKDSGFVRVSPKDPHYFECSDGTSFFPIGANLGWAGPRGAFDYDEWLPKYASSGCNLVRVFLGPSWSTFQLQKAGDPQQGLGAAQINLAGAWKLDHFLGAARTAGVKAMLCLDSANELNIRDDRPDWDQNPLNEANGGPLRVWTHFWTDPAVGALYMNKLRYLVARYSADEGVFAWELWNDVDRVQEFDLGAARNWHARTAEALASLDPYDHLLTTSFSSPTMDRDTYLLKQLDFDQLHVYGPSLVGVIADQLGRRAEWGKPSLVSEAAASKMNANANLDKAGLQVHDPLWISLVTGGAGGALPWHWDTNIDAANLYPLFSAFRAFTRDIDFPSEGFRITDATWSANDPNTKTPGSNVWSLAGNDVAIAWLQQKGRNWHTVIENHQQFDPLPPSVAVLNDLASGVWTAEVWNTWTGKVISSTSVTVGLDGKAKVNLPQFSEDLAIKLRRAKS